jgi:hypothetical protein
MVERINRISEDPVIYVIDYSNLNEDNMIGLVLKLSEEVKKANQLAHFISIFNNKSYATPRFMRSVEAATREVQNLIQDQAMVGLNPTKKIILKGYNLMFQRNFRSFETVPEAIEYLRINSSKKL